MESFEYKEGVRYTVLCGREVLLTTRNQGRAPIASAIGVAAIRLLNGETLRIEGDDGSEFVIGTSPMTAQTLIPKIEAVVPYVLATLSPGNHRAGSVGEWVEVHRGRSVSSYRQLEALLKKAQELKSSAPDAESDEITWKNYEFCPSCQSRRVTGPVCPDCQCHLPPRQGEPGFGRWA